MFEICIYFVLCSSALWPTQPPIQWVLGALLEIYQPGCGIDHSCPFSNEVESG